MFSIVSSCSKSDERVNPDDPSKENLIFVTFSVTREQGNTTPSTKSHLSWNKNAATSLWSAGDSIGVFSGTATTTHKMTLTSGEETKDGVFEGVIGADYPYYIYYPYNSSATISGTGDGRKITTSIPSVQVAGVHNVDESALVAVGKVESAGNGNVGPENFSLKNGYGVVKVTVKADNITSITVEDTSGKAIAGTFSFKAADGVCDGEVSGGSPSVTLTTSQNDGKFQKDSIYSIAVIPGTSNGLRVYVKKDGTNKSAVKQTKSVTIARNGGIALPEFSFTDADYKYYYILSKSDLDGWNRDSTNWAATDKVYLGADIDYGGAQWLKSAKPFAGLFDGRGHSITHFQCNSDSTHYRSGFFHEVSGTVQNVTFGADGDGSSIGIDGCSATEESDTWYYAGPIAYLAKGGKLKNVTNYVPVTVKNASGNPNWFRIGGIAGTMKGDNVIDSCRNYGPLTSFSDTKVRDNDGHRPEESTNLMGGIVSTADNDEGDWEITNCGNYGTITNNCPYFCRFGGIIGSVHRQATGQTRYDVTACTNSGAVTNDAAIHTKFILSMSGIVGFADTTVIIKNSHNSGNMTVSTAPVDTAIFVAGVIGYQNLDSTALIQGCSNSGNITSTPDTPYDLEIAGVAADVEGTVKECWNTGNISISGKIKNGLYCGGVCGHLYCANSMTDCWNGWDGTNKIGGDIICNCDSIGERLHVGGVLGGDNNQSVVHSRLKNYGTISLGQNASIKTKNSGRHTIGGVAGGNAAAKATYSGCSNYGNIYYKGEHQIYVGGIVAFSNDAPTDAVCEADITVIASKQQCWVGGIAGSLNVDNISNLKYVGTLTTTESNPVAYTGGIVGLMSTACQFFGCKVGGSISGVSPLSATSNQVGLICCADNTGQVFNFTTCIIRTGTVRGGNTVSELVVRSTESDWNKGVLCGGKCSEESTKPGCTIEDF